MTTEEVIDFASVRSSPGLLSWGDPDRAWHTTAPFRWGRRHSSWTVPGMTVPMLIDSGESDRLFARPPHEVVSSW